MNNLRKSDQNVLLKVRNMKKFFHTPAGVLKAIDDVSFCLLYTSDAADDLA